MSNQKDGQGKLFDLQHRPAQVAMDFGKDSVTTMLTVDDFASGYNTLKTMMTTLCVRLLPTLERCREGNFNIDASGTTDIVSLLQTAGQIAVFLMQKYQESPGQCAYTPYQLHLICSIIGLDRADLSTTATVEYIVQLTAGLNSQQSIELKNYDSFVPETEQGLVNQPAEIQISVGMKVDKGKGAVRSGTNPPIAEFETLSISPAVKIDENKSDSSSSSASSSASSSSASSINISDILNYAARKDKQDSKESRVTAVHEFNNKMKAARQKGKGADPISISFELLFTDWIVEKRILQCVSVITRHLPLLVWQSSVIDHEGCTTTINEESKQELAALVKNMELSVMEDVASVESYLLVNVLAEVQEHMGYIMLYIDSIIHDHARSIPLKINAEQMKAVNAIRTASFPLLYPQVRRYDPIKLRNHSRQFVNQMESLIIHALQASISLGAATENCIFVRRLPTPKDRNWVDVIRGAIQLLRTIETAAIKTENLSAAMKSSIEFLEDVLFPSYTEPIAGYIRSTPKEDPSFSHVLTAVVRMLMSIVSECSLRFESLLVVTNSKEENRQAAVIVRQFIRRSTMYGLWGDSQFPFDAYDELLARVTPQKAPLITA